jgi:hypothetical protein
MLWILGLAVVAAVGVYAFKRSVDSAPQPSRSDVVRIISDFVDGKSGEWDWDDFTSCPLKDPELDKVRRECTGLETDIEALKKIRDRLNAQV